MNDLDRWVVLAAMEHQDDGTPTGYINEQIGPFGMVAFASTGRLTELTIYPATEEPPTTVLEAVAEAVAALPAVCARLKIEGRMLRIGALTPQENLVAMGEVTG